MSALTSQVKTPGQIIACRFVLGFVEAPFFPGVLFYLSKWYTKKELALRMAIFYSGSLISGAFGNLIAAGILSGLAGVRGYAAWQWLYIMEGAITIFFGLLLVVVLPDFPDTWRRLSDEERHVANRRLAVDAAEADVDDGSAMSHLRGIKLALTDPKTYLLALAYHGQTGAAGIQNYFPTLTSTVQSNHIDALLLCAPPYIFMVLWSFAHSRLSDHLGKRFWFFLYPIPTTIVGFISTFFVFGEPCPGCPRCPRVDLVPLPTYRVLLTPAARSLHDRLELWRSILQPVLADLCLCDERDALCLYVPASPPTNLPGRPPSPDV